jgi:uncharacterized protein YneF (UPF0154 family)
VTTTVAIICIVVALVVGAVVGALLARLTAGRDLGRRPVGSAEQVGAPLATGGRPDGGDPAGATPHDAAAPDDRASPGIIAATAPAEPVTEAVPDAHAGATVTAPSDAPVTTQSGATVTAPSDAPVTTQSDAPVTTQSDAPVATPAGADVTPPSRTGLTTPPGVAAATPAGADPDAGVDRQGRILDAVWQLQCLDVELERRRQAGLSTASADSGGPDLAGAVQQEITRIREEIGTPGTFRSYLDAEPDPAVAVLLLRSVQSTLDVVARHAQAFDLELRHRDGRLAVTVLCDDFEGPDPEEGTVDGEAAAIASAVAFAGGTLVFDLDPGGRVRALLSVPVR